MIDYRLSEIDHRAGVTDAGSRVQLRRTDRGWWAWVLVLPDGERLTGKPEPTPENAERCAVLAERDALAGGDFRV